MAGRRVSRQQTLRDRRDSATLGHAARVLHRRTRQVTPDLPATTADGLDPPEAAAFAAVLEAAARHVESLPVGLRSDLLAAADVVLRAAVDDDGYPCPDVDRD
jgi:hypothetical protein